MSQYKGKHNCFALVVQQHREFPQVSSSPELCPEERVQELHGYFLSVTDMSPPFPEISCNQSMSLANVSVRVLSIQLLSSASNHCLKARALRTSRH